MMTTDEVTAMGHGMIRRSRIKGPSPDAESAVRSPETLNSMLDLNIDPNIVQPITAFQSHLASRFSMNADTPSLLSSRQKFRAITFPAKSYASAIPKSFC